MGVLAVISFWVAVAALLTSVIVFCQARKPR